ncbi:hypothetical protein JOD21_000830 [Jeotgalibacillus terrae]|nr:hypothetical protein [Jeotgalibacillus terrae]
MMPTGIIALIASAIWIVLILEFLKPEKTHNNRKIITLTSAGSLLTLVLTISLFQNINF